MAHLAADGSRRVYNPMTTNSMLMAAIKELERRLAVVEGK